MLETLAIILIMALSIYLLAVAIIFAFIGLGIAYCRFLTLPWHKLTKEQKIIIYLILFIITLLIV